MCEPLSYLCIVFADKNNFKSSTIPTPKQSRWYITINVSNERNHWKPTQIKVNVIDTKRGKIPREPRPAWLGLGSITWLEFSKANRAYKARPKLFELIPTLKWKLYARNTNVSDFWYNQWLWYYRWKLPHDWCDSISWHNLRKLTHEINEKHIENL